MFELMTLDPAISSAPNAEKLALSPSEAGIFQLKNQSILTLIFSIIISNYLRKRLL